MAKQLQKIEKIQGRVLRFLHDDYVSDYLMLLKASSSVSMEIRCMRYLSIEIYKTLNNLNPGYMKDIFQVQQSAYPTRRPYKIKVSRVNQTTFGTRSIWYEGAKIWNHLPNSLKLAETLEIFKSLIKTWEGPNCKCNFCKNFGMDHYFYWGVTIFGTCRQFFFKSNVFQTIFSLHFVMKTIFLRSFLKILQAFLWILFEKSTSCACIHMKSLI